MHPARQHLYFWHVNDIFITLPFQIGECKFETATSPQCHQQVCNYDSELLNMSWICQAVIIFECPNNFIGHHFVILNSTLSYHQIIIWKDSFESNYLIIWQHNSTQWYAHVRHRVYITFLLGICNNNTVMQWICMVLWPCSVRLIELDAIRTDQLRFWYWTVQQ